MNKLISTLPTGFPYEIEDLLSMQDLDQQITRHYAGLGNAFVLDGCSITANRINKTCTMTAGVVWLGGEVRTVPSYSGSYPFYIVEEADQFTQKLFFSGSYLNAYINKTAKVVTSPPATNVANVFAFSPAGNLFYKANTSPFITFEPETTQRFSLIVTHDVAVALAQEVADRSNQIDNANTQIANLINLSTSLQNQVNQLKNETKVPIGSIIDWAGSLNTVPNGWAICDGNNNTPDLRGKFTVGLDPNDLDHDTVGKTGGEKKHTLTIDEMPRHRHRHTQKKVDAATPNPNYGTTSSGTFGNAGNNTNDDANFTDYQGNGTPHENRPPFYTVIKIMRIA